MDVRKDEVRNEKSLSMDYSFIKSYGYLNYSSTERISKERTTNFKFEEINDAKKSFVHLISLYSYLIKLIHRHDVSVQGGVLTVLTSWINTELGSVNMFLLTIESNKDASEDFLLFLFNERFQESLNRMHWFRERMIEIEGEKLFIFKDEKRTIVDFIENY